MLYLCLRRMCTAEAIMFWLCPDVLMSVPMSRHLSRCPDVYPMPRRLFRCLDICPDVPTSVPMSRRLSDAPTSVPMSRHLSRYPDVCPDVCPVPRVNACVLVSLRTNTERKSMKCARANQSLRPADELVTFWAKFDHGQGIRIRQKIRVNVQPVLPHGKCRGNIWNKLWFFFQITAVTVMKSWLGASLNWLTVFCVISIICTDFDFFFLDGSMLWQAVIRSCKYLSYRALHVDNCIIRLCGAYSSITVWHCISIIMQFLFLFY